MLFGLLVFQGLSALAGGAMLFAQTAGAEIGLPNEWLARIPFASWFWPGVILGGGLGASALVLAHGVRRRPRWLWTEPAVSWTGHHWSWAGSLGLGAGLMTWIVVQLIPLPGWSLLQPLYFSVGALIVAFTLSAGRSLQHPP
jgi:hypothetical protein